MTANNKKLVVSSNGQTQTSRQQDGRPDQADDHSAAGQPTQPSGPNNKETSRAKTTEQLGQEHHHVLLRLKTLFEGVVFPGIFSRFFPHRLKEQYTGTMRLP
jgi:hypothetical protein